MPGLTALLTPKYDRPVAESISDMTEAMCHENFYVKEIFDKEHCPFVASRVHLNILNREPQPIYNENKSLLIMMDGELHSRDGIKEQLRVGGHSIKTDSDAELLLHLYEQKGEDFVHDLNGWFLALIYDIPQAKTLIVNDCFGIYRAFYARENDTFLVASEIKSLLNYHRLSFTPNEEKLAEYLLYEGVLNNETLFKEIYRLPPASIWTYKDGVLTKRQYFDFSSVRKDTTLSKSDFDEEANRIFKTIIPRYAAGENVGLSLTGGWDTRAELAIISSMQRSIPCFSWRGPHRESLDIKVAKKVIKMLGLEYHVLPIGKDFFENFPHYAHKTVYVSDGAADVYKSHEIYLNALTRNVAPIRLTGKYGTQIMSRRNFVPKMRLERNLFSKELISHMRDLDQRGCPIQGRDSILDAIRLLWSTGFLAIEMSQLVVRTPYADKELVMFLFSAPDDYLANSNVQKSIIQNNYPRLAGTPSDKGSYIKTDSRFKNMKLGSMALLFKSLTTLDKAYLHFDVPHIFTRLDPFMRFTGLEKLFLGSSYLVAYRLWIKRELRDFMQKMLLSEQTLSRPYFNAEFIKKVATDHFSNRGNYTREIGRIVSFEMWHRLFVDQKPGSKG
jgi:asparagine synthase (glutamine-hydrolysing)